MRYEFWLFSFLCLFIPTRMIFICCVCMSRLKTAPNILPNKYNDYSVKWIHLKVCNEKLNRNEISRLCVRMFITITLYMLLYHLFLIDFEIGDLEKLIDRVYIH
jgi:hypothetical protein